MAQHAPDRQEDMMDTVLMALLEDVERAADGGSNDDHVAALQEALEYALHLIDRMENA